jgi:hypothetical protein
MKAEDYNAMFAMDAASDSISSALYKVFVRRNLIRNQDPDST